MKYLIYYSAKAAALYGSNSIILDDGREVNYTNMRPENMEDGYKWDDKVLLGYSSGIEKITRLGTRPNRSVF